MVGAVAIAVALMLSAGMAEVQKAGGTLRVYHRDSPASMSILEEVTISAVAPVMAVFNNLVMFDQHVPQNSLKSIVPDLALSWAWSEDAKELTFKLRPGVRWHDGKPFTAADVECTWDLILGKSPTRLRIDPRKSWYWNLDHVAAKGNDEVVFPPEAAAAGIHRAARLGPLAGLSLPCPAGGDAPAPDRHRTRSNFVSYQPNESIKLVRNQDYWKPGRPYLDGIEWTIIPNRSTAILAFVAGKLDMTFPYEVTVPR